MEDPGVATVGEGGEKKSGSKSVGQGSEGRWVTREGHAEPRQGSLAAHSTMTAVVFSLEEEGGTEFSPSRFLSDPSSSCWGKKKKTGRKSILGRKRMGQSQLHLAIRQRKEGGKEKLMEEGELDKI